MSFQLTAREVEELRRDMQEAHQEMLEIIRAGRQAAPGEGYNYRSLPKIERSEEGGF